MNESSAEKSRKRAGARRLGGQTTTLATRSRKSPSSSPSSSASSPQSQIPPSTIGSDDIPDKSAKPSKSLAATTTTTTLCTGLSQYNDDYFFTILSRVLFPTTLSSDHTKRTWPGYLALHAGRQSLAYQCLQSLAQACTGQVARQPELITLAQVSYTNCLRRLHSQLADSRSRHDDDVLLPVTIFGAYETLFLTPSSDGWIRHTLGLAALFELRGPEAFTPHSTAFQVFRNSRQVMVMAALSARRPTFLSRSEWIEQPWLCSHTPKDTADQLMDIIAKIPELNVRSLAGASEGYERAAIHQGSLEVLTQLKQWRDDWERSPDGEKLEFPLPARYYSSSSSSTYPKEHLGPAIDYPSKYSATCDPLYQGAMIFTANIALNTLPTGMNGAAGLVLTIETAALQICRSLPYFLTSRTTQRSRLDALWSIHLAWKALGASSSPQKLKDWLIEQTDECAAAFGSWIVSPKDMSRMIRES